MTRGGKAFTIRIDPCAAGPEGAGPFCGEVLGYDDAAPGAPPLFRVPVAVVRPKAVGGDSFALTLPPSFQAGDISRNFVTPPEGAASATVEVPRLMTQAQRPQRQPRGGPCSPLARHTRVFAHNQKLQSSCHD